VFISSVTSSMTRLHIMFSRQSRELASLRWYMKANNVSDHLMTKILRNAQAATAAQQNSMPEESIELLKSVNDQLKMELHAEIFMPELQRHPFLHKYQDASPADMQQVCHSAVKSLVLVKGDVLFDSGGIPDSPAMYIIAKGEFQYLSLDRPDEAVNNGQWICEACIWMSWMHLGTMVSRTDSRICAVYSQRFQESVSVCSDSAFNLRVYAREFLIEIQSTYVDELTDLSPKKSFYSQLQNEGYGGREARASLFKQVANAGMAARASREGSPWNGNQNEKPLNLTNAHLRSSEMFKRCSQDTSSSYHYHGSFVGKESE